MGWIDPLGLKSVNPCHDKIAHGGYYGRKEDRKQEYEMKHLSKPEKYTKHIGATTAEQAQNMSKGGNSQYVPPYNTFPGRSKIEKQALVNGVYIPQAKGSAYFIYKFDHTIGYNNGKAAQWIRAEVTGYRGGSTGAYHGHAISEETALAYLATAKASGCKI